MLHSLSPDLPVEFSIRQGDPAASVFFTIYIEPLLVLLERRLRGLFMGILREASIGYMDDINGLGEDEMILSSLTRFAAPSKRPLAPSSTGTGRLLFWAWAPGRVAVTGPCPGSRPLIRPRCWG
jgi:hypothetical protein